MAIKELKSWYHDKFKSGFKIDSLKNVAGNIPTGNGNNGDHEYILSPIELEDKYIQTLLNPAETKQEIIGDFASTIKQGHIVYKKGSNSKILEKQFNKIKSISPNSRRNQANLEMFKADSEKFDFKPIDEFVNKGFSLHAKDELYRYPSIFLTHISILLEAFGPNSWQNLQTLKEQNKISRSLYFTLSFMLACSCYFRLSAYAYYESQDERISLLPISELQEIRPRLFPKISEIAGKRWILSQKLFNLYCRQSISLKNHINLNC